MPEVREEDVQMGAVVLGAVGSVCVGDAEAES